MVGQFRYTTWDPVLIVSQIVTMQAIFYGCLSAWMVVMDLLLGDAQSLDHIFSYQELEVRKVSGRMIIAAFVLNSISSAVGLWYVVKRTKQCLDFSVTAYVVHLFACWFYNCSFPSSVSWWLLCFVCTTLMCVCGEFLCMRTELKAIPVSMGPKVDL